MRCALGWLVCVLIATTTVPIALRAQDFQLVEPGGTSTADISLQPGAMTVRDASGRQYVFRRDRSFDSIDGRYEGYWQPSLHRVMRFPKAGQGSIQVADLDDASPHYVTSRRTVRPHPGGHAGRPPVHHHSPHWGHHQGYPPGLAFIPPRPWSPYGYWPYGYGYGYGYLNFGSGLTVGGFGPGFGGAGFGPTGFGPPGYYYPAPLQSIVLDSRVVPRESLPPVTLNLANSAQREVRVTIVDQVAPDQSKRIRIPAGASVPFQVQRDAGAELVRTVLTYAPDGSQITRQISTPIPPSPRYELTVHEWRLQSVAIDRTGKSPNVIEDTNYQGRGIGSFTLPPGDAVTAGTLDVVSAALQAGNAGAIAPLIDPQDAPSPLRPVSPLERMLQQQQRAGEN